MYLKKALLKMMLIRQAYHGLLNSTVQQYSEQDKKSI